MPELPDVEVYRRILENKGLGRRIARVDLREPNRLKGAERQDLEAALKGRELTAARRHGKVLFARAGASPWLVMHFGMTGALVAYHDASEEPGHVRLTLDFEDGGHLAFDNPRKFGWLELADEPDAYLAAERIGPDALEIGAEAFAERIGGSRGMIKSALMDQAKIAGLGNVCSDEILFQAGIAPETRAAALPPARLAELRETMRRVLREAARAEADPARMPGDWLTPHRGEDADCPRCGTRLQSRKVGGRTAWLCPRCQPAA
ncbi:MAG: Fpg/Nei family DNA glycosylase [Pseudomonadota bacterium]